MWVHKLLWWSTQELRRAELNAGNDHKEEKHRVHHGQQKPHREPSFSLGTSPLSQTRTTEKTQFLVGIKPHEISVVSLLAQHQLCYNPASHPQTEEFKQTLSTYGRSISKSQKVWVSVVPPGTHWMHLHKFVLSNEVEDRLLHGTSPELTWSTTPPTHSAPRLVWQHNLLLSPEQTLGYSACWRDFRWDSSTESHCLRGGCLTSPSS